MLILDKFWPGGSDGVIREGFKTISIHFDLRPAINFAADYLLFNAVGHDKAFLAWRPWIVEDESLSSNSALFPGTVKLATANTLFFARTFHDGRPPPAASCASGANRSLKGETISKRRPGVIADYVLWGQELIDTSEAVDLAAMRAVLGDPNDGLVSAVLAQCFDVCKPLHTWNQGIAINKTSVFLLLPSAMQCWRVHWEFDASSEVPRAHSCSEWGAEAQGGTCATLLGAMFAARDAIVSAAAAGVQPPKRIALSKSATVNQVIDALQLRGERASFDPFEEIRLALAESMTDSERLSRLANAYEFLGDKFTSNSITALRDLPSEGQEMPRLADYPDEYNPRRSAGNLLLNAELTDKPTCS